MKLSKLIKHLQTVKKAERDYDPEVHVWSQGKIIEVTGVATRGDYTILLGEQVDTLCYECCNAVSECECDSPK